MDTLTVAQRADMMARIRSINTKPEIRVRSVFHRLGFRFRLHPQLIGHPDFVLPKYRVVVFVHGCFWHRHLGCRGTRTPKSRVKFWTEKFRGNVRRDRFVKKKLRKDGWRVLVIWECEINIEAKIKEFMEALCGH